MHTQAGLSADAGAHLATANYVGYLAGALAGILAPALVRSRIALRGSLALLTGTLAAMPLMHTTTAWGLLRLLAGAASALVFVVAAGSLLHHLRDHPPHLSGWAFGGVGGGIALSGLLILLLRPVADWRAAWWAAAALTTALAAASWNLRPEEAPLAPPAKAKAKGNGNGNGKTKVSGTAGTHRHFGALLVSYTLEGVGYIVAGTFLVAAIGQGSEEWVGSGAWVLVGLAAVPSAALWARLGRRWSRPGLLFTALLIQATGIALPALVGGTAAALVSAVLFGATFIGVSALALAAGAHLRFPRSVALLTAGYSAGQIGGPLLVAPLLHHGYDRALLLAAAVVLAAAASAAVLRIGFPHRVVTEGGRAAPTGPEAATGTTLVATTASDTHAPRSRALGHSRGEAGRP
nr:YbfB/YjiJ family MFS transporter [Streptomyces kunmingensis]